MEDGFKDSGKYFGEGEYVELPVAVPGRDWTVEAWFIWMDGDGPLIEAEDGSWAVARDLGG